MQNKFHVAIAKCKCGRYIFSLRGGMFRYCECGESFIDQERFSGAWVRLGGDCEFIEQICPPTCDDREEHKENKVIETVEELKEYLKKMYKLTYKQYNSYF